MITIVPLLVVVGVFTGILMAKIKHVIWRRTLGWLVLISLVSAADFVMRDAAPLWRMVGICCVLLGGMKGLVYTEWAGTRTLPLPRYGIFAFLWFGMDPGSFRVRRGGLSWRGDIGLGLLLMLIGTLGAWLVWAMEWRQIFRGISSNEPWFSLWCATSFERRIACRRISSSDTFPECS